MATLTKRIGLSLGADLCWPRCFEQLLARLDPTITMGEDRVRVESERVTIEPFDLRAPVPYDLVIDRLTHWYGLTREGIKKAVLLDGTYVFNNPWSVQSMEKQTSYCAMMKLGLHVPDTWLLPPKSYDDLPDLEATLERYARLFNLDTIGEDVGYPMFMKPYDGGGWVGVTKIDNKDELATAYDKSGKFVMHLQSGILPYDCFVRCIGIGPQVRTMRYNPSAPLHDRYEVVEGFIGDDAIDELTDITLTINSFFGWDFNSCESLRRDGIWHPIDFANPCPDSQVTSLHYHFPWYIASKIRWSVFCAATQKPMRQNLDWPEFYAIDEGLPYRERLREYARIANARFETDRFHEFCDDHLANLDEVVWNYFSSDRARSAVRQKVEALYPEDEHDEFTDLFWNRIQDWRSAYPAKAKS